MAPGSQPIGRGDLRNRRAHSSQREAGNGPEHRRAVSGRPLVAIEDSS